MTLELYAVTVELGLWVAPHQLWRCPCAISQVTLTSGIGLATAFAEHAVPQDEFPIYSGVFSKINGQLNQ